MAVEGVRDRMLHFQAAAPFAPFPFHERLRLAVEQANIHINNESLTNADYAGMGATFTAAGVHDGSLVLAQIGDSRCYLIRGGRIHLVTHDQSLVWQLVEAGHITEEEAETHQYKNVILQALGAQPRVNVVVDRLRLHDGDLILLCSDGLSGRVRAEEMLQTISEAPSLRQGCEHLIQFANERGGDDNITVVLARYSGSPQGPPGDIEIERIERDPDLPYDLDFDPFATDPDTTLPLSSQRVTSPLSPASPGDDTSGGSAPTGRLRRASTSRLDTAELAEPEDAAEDDGRDGDPTAELAPKPDVFSVTSVGMPAVTTELPPPRQATPTEPLPPASYSKPLQRPKSARGRRAALGLVAAIAALGAVSLVIWNIQLQRSRAADSPPGASPPAGQPTPAAQPAADVPATRIQSRISDLNARLDTVSIAVQRLEPSNHAAAVARVSSARAKLQEATQMLPDSVSQAEALCDDAQRELEVLDRDFLSSDPLKPDADGRSSG
jgi:serine/threonine protein phosphatase PrpC